ncbi:hypothetical protein HNY73_021463 [Argiope bruennichi]|uniref:TIL domain-containing protein n=1 Tax=Argiope bruennichi TaxID=94029 RepID=A0A8T0E002_ARGBR|nr:hypothetical protein HNY73_021463 [Argiope bruennichi]
MKAAIFLCCVLLVISIDAQDDFKIDQNFYKNFGYDVNCNENQTFSEYSMCEKRCDQMNPPENCPDVDYVGCGCKDGYIPVDKSFHKCVLPQDCP